MAYHTTLYLLAFLPAVLVLYQLVPARFRWLVLIAASYLYFWLFSGALILYLIGTTVLVFAAGRRIEFLKRECVLKTEELGKAERSAVKKQYKHREKRILIAVIVILVAVLAYLKYYNFFAKNANAVLAALGAEEVFDIRILLVPIGISFYTLEAIGYITDVYWEKIPAGEPFGKTALFLSFFPQVMEGPIALYGQTADRLWSGKPLKLRNLSDGAVRILWGLFKKAVIADRLYLIVTELFENYESYHGAMILVAALSYTVQLYMEFSGCMDIVIGSGQLFGVTLPENFSRPFSAKSAAEFWRRWHISLGVWFRTYIFYPVSASALVKKWNKFAKKKYGKHITKIGVSAMALFPVWLSNGIWHGASWNYIFYGMYYFVILMAEVILEPVGERIRSHLKNGEKDLRWTVPMQLRTWVIIFTGELFFRANGIKAGVHMFLSMFRGFDLSVFWNGTMLRFGLDKADFLVIFFGLLTVGIVSNIEEHNRFGGKKPGDLKLPVRWGIYYALILAVIIFGAYGVGYQQVDLIYAGF